MYTNLRKSSSAHDDFVGQVKAWDKRSLQTDLDEVVAKVTGAGGKPPVYGDRAQFFALPFILSQSEWDEWRRASEFFVSCIHRYASARLSSEGERFLLAMGVLPEQVSLLSLAGSWPSLRHILARPDFVQGPAGPLFLEANIDSSLGGLGTADPLSRVVGSSSTVVSCVGDISETTRLAPTLAGQLVEAAGMTGESKPHVVIVDWESEIDEAPWPYDWLMRDLAECGFRVNLRSERNYSNADLQAHFIYRGITPVSTFWERIDAFREVWKAAAAGVTVISTLWDIVLSSKAMLGELWRSAEVGELSTGDAEFVRAHLPWSWPLTRRQCIRDGQKLDTLAFAANAREQLVLKSPSDGSCTNVVVGRYCTHEKWKTAVGRAARLSGYVLQQYVEPALRSNLDGRSTDARWQDFHCVDAVFVLGGRATGTCIRGTPPGSPFISCVQGAQEGIALVR